MVSSSPIEGEVPPLALLAAPREGREVGPRTAVGLDIGRDTLHVRPPVLAIVRTHRAEVGFAELAPMQVELVERNDESVQSVLRQVADHAPDTVAVVILADLVPAYDILDIAVRRGRRRRFGCGRDGRRSSGGCRSYGSGRKRFAGSEPFRLAVGIADIVDLGDGQHIGRTVGIRPALVPHRIGRHLRDLRLDARSVALDDQILRRSRNDAAREGHEQRNCIFIGKVGFYSLQR